MDASNVGQLGDVDITQIESISEATTYRVSDDMARWLRSLSPVWIHDTRRLGAIVDYIEDDDWSALGMLADPMGNPWEADRKAEDAGGRDVPGAHVCEMARAEANMEHIRDVLGTAEESDRSYLERPNSWSSWHTVDNVLVYDVGAPYTREAIRTLESRLDDYPILPDNESREDELMCEAMREGFDMPEVYGDIEPDHGRVFEAWCRLNNDRLCPECGIEYDEEDALYEAYPDRVSRCLDCDDLIIWDGYGKRRQYCQYDERDRAHSTTGRDTDVDWDTGAHGLVIMFDGRFYMWNHTTNRWQHAAHLWEDAVNY